MEIGKVRPENIITQRSVKGNANEKSLSHEDKVEFSSKALDTLRMSPSDPDPNIIDATDANFDEMLKTSHPVMVDFYNPG